MTADNNINSNFDYIKYTTSDKYYLNGNIIYKLRNSAMIEL